MLEDDVDDFGEPIEVTVIETTLEPDFCPYKKRRCMCWDQGNCQASTCILETEQ
jgi:hypothetical protein